MNLLRRFQRTIHLPQVKQETDSHCGPAVIQMLLAYVGKKVTQEDVVSAARIKGRLKVHGARPDQLARAVEILAPDLQFWFKQHATSADLDTLTHEYRWPVGINWQGLFYDTLEEEKKEDPEGDHGHYSVVIDVNKKNKTVTIADTYEEYYSKEPRTFALQWFHKRWWDVDHIKDKKTGKMDSIATKKLIFIITHKDADFPKKLGMQPPEKLDVLTVQTTNSTHLRQHA